MILTPDGAIKIATGLYGDHTAFTQGDTFPSDPREGDRHLLQVGPIYSAQLNGNPANGATTLVVDNATVIDTVATGHHIFLLDSDGKRIEEGMCSGGATATNIAVYAQNWNTDGWLDNMYVEIGARDSVWTYIEGKWKCPMIDRVHLEGNSNISHSTSGSYSTTGLKVNIILPVECQVELVGEMNALMAPSGSIQGNEGCKMRLSVDSGASYVYGGWSRTYNSGNTFRHGGSYESTAIDELTLAAGTHQVDLQWCWYDAATASGTVNIYRSTYPDWNHYRIHLFAFAV